LVRPDNRRIDAHQVRGRRLFDIGDQILTERDKRGDDRCIEIPFGAEVPDDESAVADVVAGVLKKLAPLSWSDDAWPAFDWTSFQFKATRIYRSLTVSRSI
jgi:hypothetical protein